MVQGVPSRCPACGAEVMPGQRFCPRCGHNVFSPPNTKMVGAPQQGFPLGINTSASQPPQPRGPARAQEAAAVPPTPFFGNAQLAQGLAPENARLPREDEQPSLSSLPTAILPGTEKKKTRRTVWIAGIVLLLVVLLVSGGVVAWQWYSSTVQPEITTRSIQEQVTYAGLQYTVDKVEQSQAFLDDPVAGRSGVVRVYLQAQNSTTQTVSTPYADMAHLELPGGKSLAPVILHIDTKITPGGTQSGYLDFRVPDKTTLSGLSFSLGRADEAQVLVPFNGQKSTGDGSIQKTPLSATLRYQGLDWTLVSATTELGRNGEQAKKGMQYVTLALQVANPLSQVAIPGSPFDYMRLKAGSVSASPEETTLPVSFEAGATGKAGSVTFMVPQNSSSLTLVLVAQPQNGFDQATRDFTLK